ncbi:hypothetical protein LIER_18724 [Lithospermum erythrorhizon]|uniref:Uncharacterized protein n=1 Tax=Lithospermum erythrorhizon TaxID=34254 RepID=A0AAV3QHP5_LITER
MQHNFSSTYNYYRCIVEKVQENEEKNDTPHPLFSKIIRLNKPATSEHQEEKDTGTTMSCTGNGLETDVLPLNQCPPFERSPAGTVLFKISYLFAVH